MMNDAVREMLVVLLTQDTVNANELRNKWPAIIGGRAFSAARSLAKEHGRFFRVVAGTPGLYRLVPDADGKIEYEAGRRRVAVRTMERALHSLDLVRQQHGDLTSSEARKLRRNMERTAQALARAQLRKAR